ncbi:hypothetical protein Bbelb_135240 [Branchiostoma belcheri]|nr:hypothetical protein Bbelb_135240 [Branchiostoma belcheri]
MFSFGKHNKETLRTHGGGGQTFSARLASRRFVTVAFLCGEHPSSGTPSAKKWAALNRARCGVGRTRDNLLKWGRVSSADYPCGHPTQSMQHILQDCELGPSVTKRDLYDANQEALDWLEHGDNKSAVKCAVVPGKENKPGTTEREIVFQLPLLSRCCGNYAGVARYGAHSLHALTGRWYLKLLTGVELKDYRSKAGYPIDVVDVTPQSSPLDWTDTWTGAVGTVARVVIPPPHLPQLKER